MGNLTIRKIHSDVHLYELSVELKTDVVSFYADGIYLDEWMLNRWGEILTRFNQSLKPGTILCFGVIGALNARGTSAIVLEAISTDKRGYTLFKFYGETMPEENQRYACQEYFKLPVSELDKLCVNFPGKVLNNGIELVFE